MVASHFYGDDAKWRRVTRAEPCPVCEHDSWCTFAPDRSAVRCKRIASERGVPGEDGVAWLHVLANRDAQPLPRRKRLRVAATPQDLRPLAEQWQRALTAERLAELAAALGLEPAALNAIGCGWNGSSFTFPMHDANDRVVGIRLRCPRTGRKFAHAGSKEGVFRATHTVGGMLLLAEGATDTAAGFQLGFDVIGRPSCSGGTRIVAQLVRGRDVVVVADRDEPGIRGGESLACAITPYATSLRVVVPPEPHKDLRDWLRAGTTHDDVHAYVEAHLPRRLTTHVRVRP